MAFCALKEKNKIVQFIREYYKKENLKGAVIGISGGKDSAVVAGLFCEALGNENVVGVYIPCESNYQDEVDAEVISKHFQFELLKIDLNETFHIFKKAFQDISFQEEDVINSNINAKARLRMATLYYIGAMYSHLKKGTYIVAGTTNKLEAFVGYFTKGGDSVSDIRVLVDLTVDEIIQLGNVLNVPQNVLYKKPSDGISGYSDEEKMGVTYKDIEKYINNEELPEKIKSKIEYLHKNSMHKFEIPNYLKCD